MAPPIPPPDPSDDLATLRAENEALRARVEALAHEARAAQAAAPIGTDGALALFPGVLFVFDLIERRPLYVSSTSRPILGYPVDEWVVAEAQIVSSLLHRDDMPSIRAYVERLAMLRDGEVADGEWRCRHRNGGWSWVFVRCSPHERNPDGSVRSIVGITLDLTERRGTESALQASETRYRLAAHAAHDAIADLHFRTGTVWCNHTFREMFADPPSSPPDALAWWLERVHIEDRARVQASFDETRARGASEWADEYRIRRADGTWADVLDRVYIEFADHLPARIVSSLQDRTQQKAADRALTESQRSLQLAFQAAHGGSWDTDLVGGVSWWSPELVAVWGLTPTPRPRPLSSSDPESLRDPVPLPLQEPLRFVHPDDVDALARALYAAGDEYESLFRILHPTRGERWMTARGRFVRNSAGHPVRLYGITMDVTEIKRAEQALIDEARHKDRFLSFLSHELRNPLAPLLNGLRLLHRTCADNPPARGLLEMMDRQLAQLVHLVDDLLDVSRISRDKIDLRRRMVSLREVVASALETSRPLLDARDHTITVSLPDADIQIDADPTRLAQVFSNLLNNAAKYTPRHGFVHVEGGVADGEIWVSVCDNGTGIHGEQLGRVFDMFVQAGTETSGLGIGLTIVKRLVELHEGRVDAHSDGLGKGSRFTVRLPHRAVTPAEAPVASPAGSTAPAPRAPLPRVLIVDDNRDGADTLALLAAAHGVVEAAYTGEEAVAAFGREPADVVVMDIGLPGMDGYQVCRTIRTFPRGAEALMVAMTGWGQEEDRHQATSAGFDHHLVKPVDPEQVFALIAARSGADRPGSR